MHELSLAEAMIEQLEEVCSAQSVKVAHIQSIKLELGAMSGVDRESFEFVFPIAAKGTVASGATLEFDEQPLVLNCRACGATTRPGEPIALCGDCGSADTEIVSGRTFRIMSMEVTDV